MPKQKRRSFTQAFKLAALSRMATAPSIVGLAQELGLERKLLYCWRDGFENGGSAALRQAGRPAQASLLDAEALPAPGPALGEDANASRARRQIEELQRKIGRQQLDLDFFRAALRHAREQRRRRGEPGETASTP